MKTAWRLTVFFVGLILASGQAQFDSSQFSGGFNSANTTAQNQDPVEPDTFDVVYFFKDNIGLLIPYSDTLLTDYFEQYDPARKRQVDHAQLGNLGTPFIPQLFETRSHLGLDIGFHQFDLYKKHHKELPFYITEKPFADLYFAQGPSQENTFFKAKFTRNFGEDLNLSIDYHRMNNDGQFKSQETINTGLALGFWYNHKGGKYDAFFTYTSNTHDLEDNGGVDVAALNADNIERVFTIPVFLRNARTYHVSRGYNFSHQYNVLGQPDTASTKSARSFILGHDLVINTNRFKFYDTAPTTDSTFYDHLMVDSRGLRHFIQNNSIENNFSLSTSKSGDKTQRDLLKVSLEHQLHFLKQEPGDSTINHLILGGQWNFAPSERLKMQTQLSYNLLANFGDYRLQGDLFFDFKKAGNFKASVVNQLYSPSLIQQQMFISEQSLWKNNFDKTFETSLAASYALPHLGFSVTGQYHLIDQLIYWDTLAIPRQTGTPVNVLQLILNQNFKLWKLHLDNTLAFQTTTEDVIRVPSYFSKHNFYFEGKVFRKVMLLRLGMDLRLVSPYFANYYQPLTGQFHLQDGQEIGLYPAVDAYTSFKVKLFRFFVRAENLTQLVRNDLYYQVAGYAQPYMTIKFGLSWQLLN